MFGTMPGKLICEKKSEEMNVELYEKINLEDLENLDKTKTSEFFIRTIVNDVIISECTIDDETAKFFAFYCETGVPTYVNTEPGN